MHLRKLKQEEIDISIQMSEFAFQLELTEEQKEIRRKTINPNDTWVITENETIISKMTVLPLSMYIQGRQFQMGGVSGVATWPEYRRGGLVKQLLHQGLQEMKDNGQTISLLFPFSVPFYRKYGWELFCDKKNVSLTKEQLPKFSKGDGTIKRVQKCFELLNPIYEQFAKRYNGMLQRDKVWWESRVFPVAKGQIAVYYDASDKEQGYLIYDVKEQKLKIQEFIFLTVDAWKQMWNFISNHDSMISTVEFTTFADDQTTFLFHDPRIEQKLEPYFMARIVDVKNFLELFPFQLAEGETIVFHVDDSFCEWNNGTFFVKKGVKEDNEVTMHKTNKEGAVCSHPPKRGIRCSIQQLTTMLFNYQNPHTLLELEAITGSKNEVDLLTKSTPNKKPALFDFF